MNGAEDTACEKYFTPPTLTKMLEGLGYHHVDIVLTKRVFKDWLRTVGLPDVYGAEPTRQLLITLADEPC